MQMVLAVAQVGTAIGLVVFWQWWLRSVGTDKRDTSWWPEGYEQHERAFVVADHVLSGLLIMAAAGHFMRTPWADSLSLVTAGMMLFLAMLDASYFTSQQMWRAERDGVGNALIVGWLTLLGLFSIVVVAF